MKSIQRVLCSVLVLTSQRTQSVSIINANQTVVLREKYWFIVIILRNKQLVFAWKMQSIETLKHIIFKPMEQGPSSESDSSSASVEIICILWSRKINYHVQKSPPLLLVMKQINLVNALTTDFRFNLILSSNLSLGLTSVLFWSGFPTKFLYAHLFSHILAICSILSL